MLNPQLLLRSGAPQATVFFAQLFDDFFADFTSDSFRVPTFNLALMLEEYIYVMGNKNIDRSHLKTLRNEIKSFLHEDIVAKRLVGSDKVSFVLKRLTDADDTFDVDGLLIALYRDVSIEYYRCATKMLTEEIEGCGDLSKIYKISKVIASQIKNSYSRHYIRSRIDDSFCGNYDAGGVNEFLSSFNFEAKNYFVYLNIPEGMADFFGRIGNERMRPVDRAQMPRGKRAFKQVQSCKTIRLDVRAHDVGRAAEFSISVIEFFSSIAVASAHREDVSYAPEMLVWDRVKSHPGIIYKPGLSNMKKRGAGQISAAMKDFARHFALLDSDNNDSDSKVLPTLRAHKRAVEASGPENQIVMLWFAFEALMPERSERSGGFEGYIKTSEAPIMISYLYRRVLFVFNSIRNANKMSFPKILRKVPNKGSFFSKFVAAIIDPANVGRCDEISALLENDPLRLYRFNELKNSLPEKKVLVFTMDRHWKMVEWHLRRVYRVRNVLVHEARAYPCDLDSLCVHFHEYYDTVLEQVVDYSERSNVMNGLFNYFRHISADYYVYKDSIKSMPDKLVLEDVRKVLRLS